MWQAGHGRDRRFGSGKARQAWWGGFWLGSVGFGLAGWVSQGMFGKVLVWRGKAGKAGSGVGGVVMQGMAGKALLGEVSCGGLRQARLGMFGSGEDG